MTVQAIATRDGSSTATLEPGLELRMALMATKNEAASTSLGWWSDGKRPQHDDEDDGVMNGVSDCVYAVAA